MTSERKFFFLWEYNLVVAYRMYMYVMDSDSQIGGLVKTFSPDCFQIHCSHHPAPALLKRLISLAFNSILIFLVYSMSLKLVQILLIFLRFQYYIDSRSKLRPKFGTGKLVQILVVWEDRVRFMEKKRAKVRGVRDIQARNYESCQHPVKDFVGMLS